MPNLVEIRPAVWPPNPRQTDRQADSLFRSDPVAALLFREGAHLGKIRLEKKERDRKNRKKTERASLHHTNGSLV